MNELITSHQSGRNSSKAVTIQYLVRLRLGITAAMIYLGHAETLANTDVFGSLETKQETRRLGVWTGVTQSGAVIPFNGVKARVDAQRECEVHFLCSF